MKITGKAGRNIDYDKLYDTFKKKAKYWARVSKSGDKWMERVPYKSVFIANYSALRLEGGYNSRNAVNRLAQSAGSGLTAKQITALQIGVEELTDKKFSISGIIHMFTQDEIDAKKIKGLIEDGKFKTLDELKAALLDGTLTLKEAYYIMKNYLGYNKIKAGDWISQNIFGSY